MRHWSFVGLEGLLSTEEDQREFFKPSRGCACVFGPSSDLKGEKGASVRICEEISPMGVTSYVPKDWDVVESLSPADFHSRLQALDSGGGDNVLVDVRNHYESRIGYFIDPKTGEPGLRPGIRRFGQWPQFVRRHLSSSDSDPSKFTLTSQKDTKDALAKQKKSTHFMTYCTGGIRCEKGARFLAENLALEGNSVCTLRGGIQAYLMWMDEEIKAGRKSADESFFKGKNYVFDARGATGLTLDLRSGKTEAGGWGEAKVASCHVCGKAEDRLSKCRSKGCHLILVVCTSCEEADDPRCCVSCGELDELAEAATTQAREEEIGKRRPRPICECEREREFKLWGEKSGASGVERARGRRCRKGKNFGITVDKAVDDVDVRIKAIK